jgi:UDP-N-acetylglucosamine 2-epimerase (non-hydrolysing)
MAVKVVCVAGARPNFVKIGPILRALGQGGRFEPRLVHTGQHYDERLSRIFFEDLRIPRPDVELDVGSGSHAAQTAEIMRRFEPALEREQPGVVLVVGDVNSTIACTLAAAKFWLVRPFRWRGSERRRPLVVHVEAGLRSFDDDMPEEINRRLTDSISDLLFVSDPAGLANLAREGVAPDRVFFVGNVMIDTLMAARERAEGSRVLERLGVRAGGYGLVTLHRPSNVDDPAALAALVGVLDEIAGRLPLVFPIHPRTRERLEALGPRPAASRWILTEPQGYLDFLKLTARACVVLTDSGGVQEETTVLGVPCVTLRANTERPVTVEEGTNFLAGTTREGVLRAFDAALKLAPRGRVPRLWDGKAAERVADVLARMLPAA